jgi:hypothetical protein
LSAVDIRWEVESQWRDGCWWARAVGPVGARRPVAMAVSSTSLEGSKALLQAMLWLTIQHTMGLA